MLKPGTILDDRYEIIDVVGTGGMSTGYRAKDERLKRFVAIKNCKLKHRKTSNRVIEAHDFIQLKLDSIVLIRPALQEE